MRLLRRPSAQPAIVFLLALGLLLPAGLVKPPRPFHVFDQAFYIVTAWDLVTRGVYSDGVFDRVDSAQEEPPPGMFLAPGYPFVVAAAMRLDHGLLDAATCFVRHAATGDAEKACPAYTGPLVPLHMAFLAAAMAALFLAARRLSGEARVAWLAVLLAVPPLLGYLRLYTYAMTESLALALFAWAAYAFLVAWTNGTRLAALAGGLLLGLLVLTRPSHALLLPLALLALSWGALRHGGEPRRVRLAGVVLFALGVGAVTLPWAARNAAAVGHFGLSRGYGPAVLVERLAYNEMTPGEWARSFVYWLPDFGDALAERLFGTEAVRRLDWHQPDSFYVVGNERRSALIAQHGSVDPVLPDLLRDEVMGRAPWHLVVTVSMAFRGLWVGRYWMFLALALLPFGLRAARANGQLGAWLAYAAPAWIMLWAHAGLAVNQERYNHALLLSLAIAGGWGIAALLQRRWPARHSSGEPVRSAELGGWSRHRGQPLGSTGNGRGNG